MRRRRKHVVGSDLVRNISVGRDAIRSEEDAVNLVGPPTADIASQHAHQQSTRTIGHEVVGDLYASQRSRLITGLVQLPGRQARALQSWSCFVNPHVDSLSLQIAL